MEVCRGVSNNVNARKRFLLTAPLISTIHGEMCGMVNFKKTVTPFHHENNEQFLTNQQKRVKSITDVFLDHSLAFDETHNHSLYNIITDTLVRKKKLIRSYKQRPLIEPVLKHMLLNGYQRTPLFQSWIE